MIVALVMGFACGLPLLLTLSVLQAWMQEEGVDLTVIGMMALVGLPYTLKFLWAPILDRFTLPFLGRRRGWLLTAQICLMVAVSALGFCDPARHPAVLALAAFFVTFFSATQDIVVDAYRREDLPDNELGLGSSLYVDGYRVGMLLASGGGLILADHIPFAAVYQIMALCLLPGVLTTLLTTEPPVSAGSPTTLREAVVAPLVEYFSRKGALWVLAFILLYKLGDSTLGRMVKPFWVDRGYSLAEIGAISVSLGVALTIVGALIGGWFTNRYGIFRALLWLGLAQMVSNLGYVAVAAVDLPRESIYAASVVESFTQGLGTAAFLSFLMNLCDKEHAASQYAILSALFALTRDVVGAFSGLGVEAWGYAAYFAVTTALALPGLALLPLIKPRIRERNEEELQ